MATKLISVRLRDGVLVCFHDDMLDRLLEAYGTVRELDWDSLRKIPFRQPGRFREYCRIPTLVEVFELHRKHAGLIHLDIKEPGLDVAIAQLLDQMDMWDQIAFCNDHGRAILENPKIKLSRYKAGLYEDRSEVDPSAIAAALERPGDGLIVEDPRGAIVALGRKPRQVSREPVDPSIRLVPPAREVPSEELQIAILRDAKDWNHIADSPEDQRTSGERIRSRAGAAELLLFAGTTSPAAFDALEERVRNRSLHKHWMYHGLDGAMAVRSLILLKAPNAVQVARAVLWSDDPELERVQNPQYKTPRSWTDFRLKMLVFPVLGSLPGSATEELCRDYLALDDETAQKIGPPQFEEAERTLLKIRPTTSTALELMQHRLRGVRGRAILDCLARIDEHWARAALEQQAPYALRFAL